MNKAHFLTLCILQLSLSLSAQVEKTVVERFNNYKYYNTREYAYLTTDKKLYYGGETVDIGVAVLNQYFSPSDLSSIVSVYLIHEDEAYSEQFIYRLNDGMVNSVINIPFDIPTGNYQLVATTNFMRNHDLDFTGHRVPIYIQNTNESPKKVVENILFSEASEGANAPFDDNIDLEAIAEGAKLRINIANEGNTRNDLYLICEGLNNIQLTAKIGVKKGKNSIVLPLEQFKGSFQRLVLIDEELNIVSMLSYFLKNNRTVQSISQAKDVRTIGLGQTKFCSVSIAEEEIALDQDENQLLKRVYQLYFNIPLSVNLDEFSLDELTSNSLVKDFSVHSYRKWMDILNEVKADNNVTFLPEKNIQLQGEVSSDKTLSDEIIGFHFFRNGLDLTYQLDSSGLFNLELILLTGADYFKATLYDQNFRPISYGFDVNLREGPSIKYVDEVSYYEESKTNAIISEEMSIKYILSTYSDSEIKQTLFWDNIAFDQVNLTSDYVGLETFEDFIREAVANVSVVGGSSGKGISVYNYGTGTFDKPQLLVVDNVVLKDSSPLFDIPLEEIESTHAAFTEEKLQQIGNSFTKGVFAIKTKNRDYQAASEYVDERTFRKFNGYAINTSLNATSDLFSKSSRKIVNNSMEKMKLTKDDFTDKQVKIEFLKTDGSYVFYE